MPIEFPCPYCRKLLQVPDEAAGRRAKCPTCAAIVDVPGPRREPETPAGSSEPRGARPLDVIDVFHRTWRLFKASWIECLVAGVVLIAIHLFLERVLFGLSSAFGPWLRHLAYLAASTTCQAWLLTGQIRFFFKVARGQPAPLETIFRGVDRLLPMIAVALLYGLLVSIGLVLLIVPGIFLAVMFFPVFYLVADRSDDVLDAFDAARRLTQGKKIALFVIGLAATISGFVVLLFTVGVGIVFVVPFGALLGVVVYMTLAGEPTAVD